MTTGSSSATTLLIPEKVLRSYLETLFQSFGATAGTAVDVTDHLIEASLCGHDSHGALRAPWYMEKIELGELHPAVEPKIVIDRKAAAVVDGGWGFGQPASRLAMETAIAKAKDYGVATVCVRNANHMGRVGYYTSMASAADMVGMGCVNLHGGNPCVAPFGGIDRRLATNPVSISYPTDRKPNFLADMTTSIAPEGKLQVRRNKGLPAPDGWIIDHDGHPSADPWVFYNEPVGCLLPLGGSMSHKGYALSMSVEGLAGGLSGTDLANATSTRHGNACFYTVVDIEAFTSLSEFKARVGTMIDYIKSSRKAEGVTEILYPGEPEARMRAQRLAEGIPVDSTTWEWLAKHAAKVGVKTPD